MQIFTNQTNKQLSIDQIVKQMRNEFKNTIKIDHSYQRQYVWNDIKMKRELINSIIFDRPLGNIILWKNPDDILGVSEIVDGQQRINTIIDFMDNKFFLDENYINFLKNNKSIMKMLEEYSDKNDKKATRMLRSNFRKLYYKDFPDFLQQSFDQYQLNMTELTNLSREDIIEYFKVLQNQEKLKAGELMHSINNDTVSSFISKEEIDLFVKKTNFNNHRMAFTKHFGVFMGFLIDKIKIGLEDKKIVAAMEKLTNEDFELNQEFNLILKKLKNDLAKESQNVNLELIDKNLSVLGIKLLFITYLNEFDFPEFEILALEEKAAIIKKITKMAGYWNSNEEHKKEILMERIKSFIESQPSLINSDNVIAGVKEAWKVSKTTHDKKNVIMFIPNIQEVIKFILENPNFNYLV